MNNVQNKSAALKYKSLNEFREIAKANYGGSRVRVVQGNRLSVDSFGRNVDFLRRVPVCVGGGAVALAVGVLSFPVSLLAISAGVAAGVYSKKICDRRIEVLPAENKEAIAFFARALAEAYGSSIASKVYHDSGLQVSYGSGGSLSLGQVEVLISQTEALNTRPKYRIGGSEDITKLIVGLADLAPDMNAELVDEVVVGGRLVIDGTWDDAKIEGLIQKGCLGPASGIKGLELSDATVSSQSLRALVDSGALLHVVEVSFYSDDLDDAMTDVFAYCIEKMSVLRYLGINARSYAPQMVRLKDLAAPAGVVVV